MKKNGDKNSIDSNDSDIDNLLNAGEDVVIVRIESVKIRVTGTVKVKMVARR